MTFNIFNGPTKPDPAAAGPLAALEGVDLRQRVRLEVQVQAGVLPLLRGHQPVLRKYLAPTSSTLSFVQVPPFDNVTIYFLGALVHETKRHILNDDIKTIAVPQYKNLSLERIIMFIEDKPNIADFLPDELDLPKTPK